MALDQLQKALGYKFKDQELLAEALTHPSVSMKKPAPRNYERMEFLGDSVLSLSISDYLFQKYNEEQEGNLAKRRSAMVSRAAISEVAKKIYLGKYINISDGEEKNGGRNNDSNLENTMEALIGAVYLDSNFNNARKVVLRLWKDMDAVDDADINDPKSTLQEILQAEGKGLPEYKVVSQEGSSHEPIFEVEVCCEGYGSETAKGKSKKQAGKEAAEKMLRKIKND